MDWDIVEAAILPLAKFCPLCGQELVITDKVIGKVPGFQVIVPAKVCPGGDGEISLSGANATMSIEFDIRRELWMEALKEKETEE